MMNDRFFQAVMATRGTISRPQGVVSAGTSLNQPSTSTNASVSAPAPAPAPASRGYPKGKPRAIKEAKASGPDGGDKKLRKNPLIADPKKPVAPKSGIKRGLPTVSYNVGKALDDYGNIDGVELQIRHLQQARALMRRGFFTSDAVNVLAAPGSLGAPTVGKVSDQNTLSAAEASAIGNTVGQVPETPDPRTANELSKSRATTSAAAVNPSSMGVSASNAGDANAVPQSQTPAMTSAVDELQQLPTKVNEAVEAVDEAVAVRSLFKRRS